MFSSRRLSFLSFALKRSIHVLPRAIVPELAARFYNLEAIPSKLNGAKSAKLTDREVKLARRWNQEKLLSDAGLKAVETVETVFGRE